MNTIEQWTRWEPVEGLHSNYYIDSVYSYRTGLKIVLVEIENDNKQAVVIFDSDVYCYRNTYETYTHVRMLEVCERQGRELFVGTNFFKVINSSYVKLISEQSGGISDCQPLEHFVIFTPDSMLEILSTCQPRIEKVTKPHEPDMHIHNYTLKIGKLPDDNKIAIMRSHTKTGFPTLEFYNPIDRTSNKIVYTGEKKNE